VTAVVIILGFLAVVVAMLAGVVLETDADERPYQDDQASIDQARRVREALDRARQADTPRHYQDDQASIDQARRVREALDRARQVDTPRHYREGVPW
jgi:hypothetical protein